MDDLRIDSNKLMFHPDRVAKWDKEGDCNPIYIEVSPSGKCNHRCMFCALDYTKYDGPFMDSQLLISRMKDIHIMGLKSVMLAGEGEPLLHPDIKYIIEGLRRLGLDLSITTNGVYLDKVMETCLFNLSWVRISLDAGFPNTYSLIHGCKSSDFGKVIDNLALFVSYKREYKSSCTIGVQFLLLNENVGEAAECARLVKDIGVDYISFKPYSQHPLSGNNPKSITRKSTFYLLEEDLTSLQDDEFQVYFRRQGLGRVGKKKGYEECNGLYFFCYISSTMDVYPCSTFLGNKEMSYGNLSEHPFWYIWRRKKEVMDKIDISKCRENCRLDSINEYLWELRNPGPHINFI